jgi:hypothetical protein
MSIDIGDQDLMIGSKRLELTYALGANHDIGIAIASPARNVPELPDHGPEMFRIIKVDSDQGLFSITT